MYPVDHLKRRLLVGVSILVACGVVALAAHTLANRAHSANTDTTGGMLAGSAILVTIHTPFSEPISVLTRTPHDEGGGPDYSLPTKPPKITRQQAIDAARKTGLVPPDARPDRVNYVLASFPDPAHHTHELKVAGILDKYPNGFTNIPVWIVTFRGLNMPALGNFALFATPTPGSATPHPLPVNHELNLIISADTGVCMGAFTYR